MIYRAGRASAPLAESTWRKSRSNFALRHAATGRANRTLSRLAAGGGGRRRITMIAPGATRLLAGHVHADTCQPADGLQSDDATRQSRRAGAWFATLEPGRRSEIHCAKEKTHNQWTDAAGSLCHCRRSPLFGGVGLVRLCGQSGGFVLPHRGQKNGSPSSRRIGRPNRALAISRKRPEATPPLLGSRRPNSRKVHPLPAAWQTTSGAKQDLGAQIAPARPSFLFA